MSFYVADFWSLWDVGIIGIGVAYIVSSESVKLLYSQSEMSRSCQPRSMSRRGPAIQTAIER